jgi:anti-sigma factor RsiW
MSQYLDGELPERVGERVRRHLEECQACAEAFESMRAMDEALRRDVPAAGETPNLADRVVSELRGRGAFFKARVAASLLVMAGVVLDSLTSDRWASRTEPVLADAERVLVRLVYVDAAEESQRLAWAREEVRKLALPQRLAHVRGEARAAWAGDLAPLEATFTVLAAGEPLSPELADQLTRGELLERAARLHRNLMPGG